MSTISVLNQKGGTGKSNISRCLAVAFAKSGKSVCIIDTDDQSSSTKWFSKRQANDIHCFSILDSHALRKALPMHKKHFEVIIIDGTPKVNSLAQVSMKFSDLVIIPIDSGGEALEATTTIIEGVLDVQSEQEEPVKALLLLNRVQKHTALSKFIEQDARKFPLPLMETQVRDYISHKETYYSGTTVLDASGPVNKNF